MFEALSVSFGSPYLILLLIGAAALFWVISAALVQLRGANLAQSEYSSARARLPEAAKNESAFHYLTEQVSRKTVELDDLHKQVVEVRKELNDASRAQANYEHWSGLAKQAEAEYAKLADKRAEIDALRDEYERAAAALAERRAELGQIASDRDKVAEEIADLNVRLATLKEQVAQLEEMGRKVAELEAKRDALRREIDGLADARAEYMRIRFETDQLQSIRGRLEKDIAELGEKSTALDARKAALEEDVRGLSERKTELDRIRKELEEVEAKHQAAALRLAQISMECERLDEERAVRKSAVEEARKTEAEARKELEAVSSRLTTLREEVNRLEEKRAWLAARNPEADPESLVPDKSGAFDGKQVQDLARAPAFLFGEGGAIALPKPRAKLDERQALEGTHKYLKDLGLKFDERVVLRFHTSLKIGRVSPLTVLAGISGTGKSQLPQRYAEAMGIHFLKLAVQPRWDSPQDLLGFYNYLEKSYKATDLSRALLRMDRTGGRPDLNGAGACKDRVLLVLLDEMNIAKVEYYFSEFLSRLEGRPPAHDTNESKIASSRIEIEIPGTDKTHGAISIYPGHNVLFVGTMNQDESTQALSDKVLDRGNSLLFKKPEKLVTEPSKRPNPSAEHLPFETWLAWQREFTDLPTDQKRLVDETIEKLNGQFAAFGRPFGYRIAESVRAYVANHPRSDSVMGVREALADMVDMRLMPKLRGIDAQDGAAGTFRQIADLVRKDLQDDTLARFIDQASSKDVFDWAAASIS
jgi:predicted  nucleic acid-binding Zn-ribbon protein